MVVCLPFCIFSEISPTRKSLPAIILISDVFPTPVGPEKSDK